MTPVGVSKNALLCHLRDRHFGGRSPVLAVGDGLADLGLLCAARLAATPVRSGLWDLATGNIRDACGGQAGA